MRPRYLEIEGLQSFRETVKIDFDKLSETGLFGIFGPTGSGKSTVLDAITLSLYGKVTRAHGTQGIINTLEKKLRVSFTFDILKSDKRHTYKVERTYARKKGPDNISEAKIARILEIEKDSEIPLCDKSTEVTAKVEELLGLKHDDFIRAVVLPQNKFQEFLNLENAKKREMLQRIFYLEEYGKELSEKVSKKKSVLDDLLQNSQAKLSVLVDASDEALNEALKAFDISEKKKESLKKTAMEIQKRFEESKELWNFQVQKDEIEKKLSFELSKKSEIEIKQMRSEKALRALVLVDEINKFKLEEERLNTTQKALIELEGKFDNINKVNELAKSVLAKAKEKAEQIPSLIERKTALGAVLSLKKEVFELSVKRNKKSGEYKKIALQKKLIEEEQEKLTKDSINLEQNINQIKKNIEEIKFDLDYKNLILELLKDTNELDFSKKAFIEAKSLYEELFIKMTELNKKSDILKPELLKAAEEVAFLCEEQKMLLNNKPLQRIEIDEKNRVLAQELALFEKLMLISNEKNIIQNKIETQDINLKDNETRLINYEKELSNKQKEISDLEERIKVLFTQSNNGLICELAKNLRDSEQCPVCGSLDHPKPAGDLGLLNSSEQDKRNQDLQMSKEKLEKEYKQIDKSMMETSLKIENSRALISQLKIEYIEKSNSEAETLARLPESYQDLSQNEMKETLEKSKFENENSKKTLELWENNCNKIQSRIIDSTQKLSEKTNLESALNAQITVNQENFINIEKKHNEVRDLFEIKKQELDIRLQKHNIDNPSDEMLKITLAEKNAEELRTNLNLFQEKYNQMQVMLLEIQKNGNLIVNELTQIETDGKNYRQQIDEKNIKILEVAGDLIVEDEIVSIENKITQIGKDEQNAENELIKSSDELNNLNIQKTTTQSQKEIFEKIVAKEKLRIEEHLREKGFYNLSEVVESIIEENTLKALQNEIDTYQQNLRNIEAQRSMIVSKIGERNISEDNWQEISQENEECFRLTQLAFGDFEVKKNIYATIVLKNKDWKKINQDYTIYRRKVDVILQLQTILRGNSFIDFVAEERLKYVAREASDLLGVLTRYKYGIEIDSQTQFVIRDNSNGGILRMPSTLSGGETFLAALSLALALSKHIQLKGQSPLEFFFLDEGFGTLDNSLLDFVMDSLEKLSTKERIIGLISHVPELRARVSRRLIITAPTNEGAGSTANIEIG